jgi:hypothetical protein
MQVIKTNIVVVGSLEGGRANIEIDYTFFSDLGLYRLDVTNTIEKIKKIIKKLNKVDDIYIRLIKDSEHLFYSNLYFPYNGKIRVYKYKKNNNEQYEYEIEEKKLIKELKSILEYCFSEMYYHYGDEAVKQQQIKERV